jgi:ATP-dependent metallopeptidase hflB
MNSGENSNKDKDDKDSLKKFNKQTIFTLLIAAIVTFTLVSFMNNTIKSYNSKEIPYSEFMKMVDEGYVKSVEIQNTEISIKAKPDLKDYSPLYTYRTVKVDSDDELINRLYKADVVVKRVRNDSISLTLSLMSMVLPFILVFVGMNFFMKKMGDGAGVMGVGRSNAKLHVQKETGISFADVAGEDEAKESLKEIVDFLHNPERFTRIGAKLPKGALLVGPPGTGKTLLARAVAGEAKVPFFSLSGSDFVEMFAGVGASRVRDLFKQAQAAAPAIIFIDEIDAIGKSRDSRYGNDEREQTLNQLLSEMDGFDSSKGLLVLGATNRPEILDPALLRPGRFDRRVIVDRPDLKGRVAILKVHAKDVLMDETVNLDEIGLATSGAVGSDLANMINEAAILAVRDGRKAVSQKDLFESVEVVVVGKEKKDRVLNKKERSIVSYHEVGHALIAALQKNSEPVQKITIVPRTMGALGYVMQFPEEETYLKSKAELDDMIVGLFGGRAAEEIVFGDVTTGASNDIEKATAIAKAMVTQYGMSEKFGLMGLSRQEDQYLLGRTVMNCGDDTATEVDNEVMLILKISYQKALEMLKENREVMDKLAAFLIEKETITGKEFMRIFREIKGIEEPVKTLEQDEAKEIMDTDKNVKVLDVREKEEFEEGHIEGAISLPLSTINEETIKEIVPSKEIKVLLYCRSGARSEKAARALYALGYENVFSFGGIKDWKHGIIR